MNKISEKQCKKRVTDFLQINILVQWFVYTKSVKKKFKTS